MPDTDREREWLDSAERETSAQGLPRPELNPLFNPLLSENMGRWAQVYYTSPPEQREQAVEKLLEDLQAESGGTRPAFSQTPINVASPSSVRTDQTATASPRHKVECDFKEFDEQIPQFKKSKPEPVESDGRNAQVCPACLHKNAAEQRFCGICGFSLAQEPAVHQVRQDIGPEPMAPRPENPESDWQWLRQKSLANFQAVHDTNDGSRFFFGMIVLLLALAGGFFAWQNRSHLLPGQKPTSPPTAERTAAVSANIASAPAPNPPAPHGTARTSSVADHGHSNVTPPLAAPSAPAHSASGLSAQTGADDGGEELDQGRRYLEGQGVPRSSWMASQWLWKSVAKKNNDAVLLLSDLYLRGDGVAHSCEQARVLLVAAAKKGSPAAAQKLRTVETTCR